MIKEVTMFTLVCDNCGKDVNEDTDFSCWNDKGVLKELADDQCWVEVEDKHYCHDCYIYDENDEILVRGIIINSITPIGEAKKINKTNE